MKNTYYVNHLGILFLVDLYVFFGFSTVFVTGRNYYRDCNFKIEYVIMRTYK